MGAHLPKDVVDDARNTDLVSLVDSYGLKLAKQGKDYFGLCPFHSEDTASFTVYRKDSGPQKFCCMGCGAQGDAIQFVQDYEGLKFRDAVRRIVGTLPDTGNAPAKAPASKQPAEPEEYWTQITPVPDSVPVTPDTIRRKIKGEWVSVRASRRWHYRNADGETLGYVFRFDMPNGGKEVLPLVWAVSSETGECQWRWLSFSKPRPMYGLDRLAENPNAQVVVVEGEKAADAAQDIFAGLGIPSDKLVAVAWPGGGKAIKHVDFSPLDGRSVGLWPDADMKTYPANHEHAGVLMPFLEQPGTVAMLDVWQAIRGAATSVKFFMPPEDVPDGWDLADPFPAGFSLLAHMKTSAVDPATLEIAKVAGTASAEADAVVEVAGQSARALQVADAIRARLIRDLEIDTADEKTINQLGVNAETVERMICGSFWSGSKGKLFLLNEAQSLNQFHAGDAYRFLARTFGSPVDDQAINKLTEHAISAKQMEKTQAKALRSSVSKVAETVVLDHIKHYNQREGVEWRCDMFASGARMALLEDKARVVLAHKPFDNHGVYVKEIIDDYKSHFTRFDEFLEFLVQSRFAMDRKKCYLWLLADSDWGKGFLLGVLNDLRISVSTSTKEIEAMFEGRPVGRAPEDFKRAFVLVIDEFKTVKSELKQLQSEISLSPKNQLTATVEVFAKLFLSAESVASLVTENGVEDQFANRMSIFQESGSLVKRPLYIEVGNPLYYSSVLAYAAETMNRLVEKMRAMGRVKAQTHAEAWINAFLAKHGIDTVFERFSDSLAFVALDAVEWIYRQHNTKPGGVLVVDRNTHQHFMPHPSKRLDEFLSDHFDSSEVHAYRRRKTEILKHMSEDGKGPYPHRINGSTQIKSVMLKKLVPGP